ncbi:uncharacterized protein B0T23DRAFT_426042 [Neurospora hispaniola]|uniref:CRT10-domain-containing protein n=1 Tax=Neurospora hispaniola TaxID=588809 RepID=A0AAJ0IC99_9PEZI|nr:hypothetical protein B0T23DRAFT_426042 [Neurospora hispaniola]
MEPYTHIDTPRPYLSSDMSEDDSEADDAFRSSIDFLSVSRFCHVQTAESRFGADVGPEIKSFVYEPWHSFDINDDISDDSTEDELSDEIDSIELNEHDWAIGVTPDMVATWGPFAAAPLPQFAATMPPTLLPQMPIGLQAPGVADDLLPQLQLPQQQNQLQQLQQQEEMGREQGRQRFPRAQRLRLNLTALSQKYNLYFASYQNKIHAFIPRKGPNLLPGPCLVLKPKKLKTDWPVRPAIDQSFGHQINHLMIGDLGHLEVLFFAFDDGDVGAYYTHTIAHYIVSASRQREANGRPPPRSLIPREFFHENVGESAWGIAIHQESRLLAVSSNRAEVTVFAFALRQHRHQKPKDDLTSYLDPSPQIWPGQTALGLERDFQTRTRTWKIILPLDSRGSNIPNISFCDDEQGCAEYVVAQDIKQRTWFLDIWRLGYPPVDIMHETSKMNYVTPTHIGWGVMILPDRSFKQTASLHECLGLPPSEFSGGTLRSAQLWLDTTNSLSHVRDLANPLSYLIPAPHNSSFIGPERIAGFPIEEDLDEESGAEEETEILDAARPWTNVDFGVTDRRSIILSGEHPRPRQAPRAYLDDTHDGIHMAQFIVPRFAHVPDSSSLRRERYSRWRTPAVPFSKCDFFSRYATKNMSILLTSSTDVCLLHMDPQGTPVLCRQVLPYHNHLNRHQSPYDLHRDYSQRIGMLLHVPELNLVVLGSLCGRVALVRLTKTAKLFYGAPVRRGFRVEMVLPRRSEEDKRMRPWCTLHGIAISPMPDPKTDGISLHKEGDEGQEPALKKWRLVLHYLDHTILTYIIMKTKDDEDLLVV